MTYTSATSTLTVVVEVNVEHRRAPPTARQHTDEQLSVVPMLRGVLVLYRARI